MRSICIIKFHGDDYGVYLGGYRLWARGTWAEIEEWRDKSLGAGNELPSAPGERTRQGRVAA